MRALARDPSRLDPRPGVQIASGDLISAEGLERALDGCETAYYLVHSMEPDQNASMGFADRDRRAAENFAAACERAGTQRIVYLGGIIPAGRALSPHLASRLEVERVLLSVTQASTALRASIIVGGLSPSFQLLVRLIERLSVLVLPGWRRNHTCPIDERDALDYLTLTPHTPAAAGRSLDIVGPQLLSYEQMIERIAELMGVRRRRLSVDVSLTQATSAIASAVSELPLELVRPLMQSLDGDLLPRDDAAKRLYGLRLHSFDRAVEHALRQFESLEGLAAR